MAKMEQAQVKIIYGKVDAAASDVLELGKKMKTALDETAKAVDKLKNSWDSGAYDRFKAAYTKFEQKFEPLQKDVQALSTSFTATKEAYQKLDDSFK